MNSRLTFLLFAMAGFFYNPAPDLDLFRYYQHARELKPDAPLLEYASSIAKLNFDFLYFTIFLVAVKIGAPVQLITAFFVGLFYSQTVVFLERTSQRFLGVLGHQELMLGQLAALTAVTPILTFNISRNLAAFALLLLGTNLAIASKRSSALSCFFAALVTHIASAGYMLVAAVAHRTNVLRIEARPLRNLILIVGTAAAANSASLLENALLFVQTHFRLDWLQRYDVYLDFTSSVFGSVIGKLAYYDTAPILATATVMFLELLLIKKYNSFTWISFYFFFALVAFITFSVGMTNRTLVFLAPLQGLLALQVLRERRTDSLIIRLFTVLIAGNVLLFALNIYGYRAYLFN